MYTIYEARLIFFLYSHNSSSEKTLIESLIVFNLMLTLTEFSVAMHFLLTPFMRKIIILWDVRKYRFSSVMYRTRSLCRVCFIKGKKKKTLDNSHLWRCVFIIWHFSVVSYWDIMWKHGRKCIGFGFLAVKLFFIKCQKGLNSWSLEKG